MKLKMLAIASVLSLTGCVMPHGDVVSEHQVGQVYYKGGSGLVYQRATSQVSRESIEAGERYLEERRANDPLQASINVSVQRGNEFAERQDKIESAQFKCEFVVQAHEAVLVDKYMASGQLKDRQAIIHYRMGGKVKAFNKCMKNANL